MPNTILTPTIIANEALRVFQANTVMADLVHKDYSDEFQQVGDTVTIRKPATFSAKPFTGSVSAQDITESSATVKLDHFFDVTANVTSKELSLDIVDFSAQVIQPAIRALANQVDSDLLACAVAGAGYTKSATASPTNLADIADLAKNLDNKLAPMQERRLVMHPDHKYKYALTDNLSKVAYAGDNATLRDALLGRVYSLDTYMDQLAPAGAATSGTATSYKVTGTAGATTVALSDLSAATATVKKGDGFILGDVVYHFTADGTGSSSAIASIAIDKPLAIAATAAAVTLVTAPASVAFHRNGLALVTRPLALPMGASNAAIVNDKGLGIRVVYSYNQTTKTDAISFDLLYGVKVLDSDLVCKLVG